ncbi:MAG: hypothetical protein NT151_09890 [Acidobacteria bacterium]|nr:hypothetical protein [Acidobacteriota bacterium]
MSASVLRFPALEDRARIVAARASGSALGLSPTEAGLVAQFRALPAHVQPLMVNVMLETFDKFMCEPAPPPALSWDEPYRESQRQAVEALRQRHHPTPQTPVPGPDSPDGVSARALARLHAVGLFTLGDLARFRKHELGRSVKYLNMNAADKLERWFQAAGLTWRDDTVSSEAKGGAS